MKRGLSFILIMPLICTMLISCTSSEYSILEKSLDDFFTNDKTAFSGSVLIAIDDKIILKKGYGMADYENQIPNTPKTVFKIGSITKQFTSMAIMMLEERGLLSVEDPISMYISGFSGRDKIKIHHLLSMTSGIGDYISDDWADCDRSYTVDELISRILEKPISFEAGSKYEYSNSNYVLLGYIIEKVTGMEYDEFMRHNIFEPLDMENTAYDYKEEFLKHKAIGYINVADTSRKDAVIAPNMNMSYAYSAGGLYSTVEDLYKWDQALYTEKLVKKASLEKMFTPNVDNYGYGWDILTKYRNSVSHDGRCKGFTSIIYRFMDKKATIILLMNEEDMFGYRKIINRVVEIAEKYGILSKADDTN